MTEPHTESVPLGLLNTRVLVVDDQEQIHEDFREMLRPESATAASDELASVFMSPSDTSSEPTLPLFDLLHASNGEDGISVIEEACAKSKPVAVAFIDVRMPPGIDGIETVRRIRDNRQ